MQRFKSPVQAQRILAVFSRVCNLFRPRRHLLTANRYRSILHERFRIWRELTLAA
jgi:putative transposase